MLINVTYLYIMEFYKNRRLREDLQIAMITPSIVVNGLLLYEANIVKKGNEG